MAESTAPEYEVRNWTIDGNKTTEKLAERATVNACMLTDSISANCTKDCGETTIVTCSRWSEFRRFSKVRRTEFQSSVSVAAVLPDAFATRATYAEYKLEFQRDVKTRSEELSMDPEQTAKLRVYFCTRPVFYALDSSRIAVQLLQGMTYRACVFCSGAYTPPTSIELETNREGLETIRFEKKHAVEIVRSGPANKRVWLVTYQQTIPVINQKKVDYAVLDPHEAFEPGQIITVTRDYGAAGLALMHLEMPKVFSHYWHFSRGHLVVKQRVHALPDTCETAVEPAVGADAADEIAATSPGLPQRPRRPRRLVAEIAFGNHRPYENHAIWQYTAGLTVFSHGDS